MNSRAALFHAATRGVQFWTLPIRPEPYALLRILIGTCLLLNLLLTIWPNAALLTGPEGLCPAPALDDYIRTTHRVCLLRGPTSIPYLDEALPDRWKRAWSDWGARPEAFTLFLWAYLFALVGLTLGIVTRPMVVACWLLTMTMHQRLHWCMNGGDDVARMALFYLIFSRCGAVWSIDHWLIRRRRQGEPGAPIPPVPPWPLRLMQIQLCLIYLFTGLIKLGGSGGTWNWLYCDWLNGEAVYWLYNDVELNRYPYAWVPFPMWFCRLASWGVLAFELGFTFLIPFRRLRPWVLGAGVLLHLGILVHTEIAFFTPYMLCWYVVFIPGAKLASMVRGRFTGGKNPDPPPAPEFRPGES